MPRDLTARYQRQLTLVASMEVWASFPTKQKKNQIYNCGSKELIP